MRLVRHVVPALVGCLLWAVPLGAQESTGAVTGKVIDGTTQQPLPNVEVAVVGTPHRQLTKPDGAFLLSGVPAGVHRLRASRIGYGSQVQDVTVTAGQAVTVPLTLVPAAAILEEVVVTGYGSQQREAITGSVSTVQAAAANVGVVTNVDQMVQGRAAGVEITQNNGEPGAGVQVLIRGGSSISATNEPLYVVDGVPLNNVPTEPSSYGIGGSPALPRDPLNVLNPSDIASITVLKDASATAIYGSRAANGVILIETKKGRAGGGGATIEYDGYAASEWTAKGLDVLNGSDYSQFIQQQVAAGNLDPIHLTRLGKANTNWQDAISRTAVSHNQNISFTGGTEDTRYRASVNYMNQQGVIIANGLERIQGRLSATHHALDNRLRLSVNVTTSRVNDKYVTYESTGGFEGGIFQNVAIFNPTQPITVTDSTGTHYYETGSTSVRNPVGLANQISDLGQTTRTLGNAQAELDLVPGLTGQINVGLDHSSGGRELYYPNANPVGVALGGGLARQSNLDNATQTLQTLLTFRRQLSEAHSLDLVGGYEYSKFKSNSFTAQGIGFFTDAFGFSNLGAAVTRNSWSYAEESRLASFFGRANYGFKDRYFVTGVLRYDGSSKFATGHKWALFPALSASWHISQEEFMRNTPFSDLRLRAGWGLQGNPGVPAYSSLLTLEGNTGASYPWGGTPQGGVIPTRNANPNLKWEQTSQVDVAADFSLLNNRLSGTVEYYVKKTKDLLLQVPAPQPAAAASGLQNIGRLSGHGIEVSLDAVPVSRPGLSWRAGLVFAAERGTVDDLGPCAPKPAPCPPFITSGNVSGQGQSNQVSQQIMPGYPLGTFYGPVFVGVNSTGAQLFRCVTPSPTCVNGQTTSPAATDYAVIGNANPNFTLGAHSRVDVGNFSVSFLVRAVVGQDVFNNTALVYSTKGNALQDKNFLRAALTDGIGIHEPAIFSSHWIESGTFVRLQNVTVEYNLDLPILTRSARSARLFLSGDNLVLLTSYSGVDPEISNLAAGTNPSSGLAARGIDYLSYPRPRTVTGGLHLVF